VRRRLLLTFGLFGHTILWFLRVAETADVTYWRLSFVDTSKNLTQLPRAGHVAPQGFLMVGLTATDGALVIALRDGVRSGFVVESRTLEFCFTGWTGDRTAAKRACLVHRSRGNRKLLAAGYGNIKIKDGERCGAIRRSATGPVVSQLATSLTFEEMAAKKFGSKKMTLYTVSLYDMICFILLGAFPIAYLCTRERK
jgi:hypothetical protein